METNSVRGIEVKKGVHVLVEYPKKGVAKLLIIRNISRGNANVGTSSKHCCTFGLIKDAKNIAKIKKILAPKKEKE